MKIMYFIIFVVVGLPKRCRERVASGRRNREGRLFAEAKLTNGLFPGLVFRKMTPWR